MTSNFFYKFFIIWMVILSMAGLTGCSAPASKPLATATVATCQPSQVQISKIEFHEIQGKMKADGEMWALLFFDKAHAKEDLKIVWKITGSDEKFTVQARNDAGTVIFPIWGPEDHGGSNWQRPGHEWGTGFNFPEPGCWTLTAVRGAVIGEISLDILAP